MNDCYEKKKKDAVLSLRVQKKQQLKKNIFLSTLIFCLLFFLFSEFLYFVFIFLFEYLCDMELTWRNEWMDLCTNTEAGRVWTWFFRTLLVGLWTKTPCGLWPPASDSQFWTPWEFWISKWFGSNTWLIPLHGRTVWRESSLHSQLANYPSVLLSESSPWCMKKGRTTHYNRRVLKNKQTNKKTPSQHLSSLQRQSFRYSIILKKKKKRWRF